MIQLKPISLTTYINGLFIGKEPWQISAISAVSVVLGLWIWDVVAQPESTFPFITILRNIALCIDISVRFLRLVRKRKKRSFSISQKDTICFQKNPHRRQKSSRVI